jgi:hypothetical protein
MNWFARYQGNPPGVGYYEFAVNANGTNVPSLGGFDDTDVFGVFTMPSRPAGSYTVASWDVWWRSAYAFNVAVPASGSTADVDLRLRATMWGYPAFWDSAGFYELGQTFVATGPISMIYLRDPLNVNFTRTLTVREGGPGGAQVGVTRTWGGNGDQRLIYGYGDMPTVAGRTYYARIRTPAAGTGAVIMQMDPRPDFSDPMPGGCLYLGDGTKLTPQPDRDLGLVIMSDDDGLITDLYTRHNGTTLSGVSSVGQTFVARGVNLISAAFWLADTSVAAYVVSVYQGAPGGAVVGTIKRNKPARVTADPQMIVCWAPGECPLTPGQTYYIEVTRDGGGTFNSVYANNSNAFPFGQAYQNGAAATGVDLAGTFMEEASAGSATMPAVQLTSDLTPTDAGRGTNSLTITWTTDIASDSAVEFAIENPPYTRTNYSATLVTSHSITLSNLEANAMYHYRLRSDRAGYRTGVSRDLVVCTRPVAPNLLGNPGFEQGSGASPRSVTGWSTGGTGLDLKQSDGTWFGGIPSHSGSWLLQGSLNGGSSDAWIYQRVTGLSAGRRYTFSAWVTTWMRENGAFKYDVWNSQGRLIHVRLGLDPTGGTDANAASVQWTPRTYSHLRYGNLAKSAVAQGTAVTVFVRMTGSGGEWHLYGVDDAVLTETAPLVPPDPPAPLQAVATPASNTITLTLSAPAHPAATNPANYSIQLGGTNALAVLSATLVDGTNVILVTAARAPRADYNIVVSNLVHVSASPGTNVFNGQVALRVPLPLIALDAATQWKYEQRGANLGSSWRGPAFNDNAWPAGAALFAFENAALPEHIRTPLTTNNGKFTFYFRKKFTLPFGATNAPLALRQIIDDGVVYYLNGLELFRLGVATDPVLYNDPASRTVSDAVYEGPFILTPGNLLNGTNVLAAEVHQVNATSSDVVFGLSLEGRVLPSQTPFTNAVLSIVRIGNVGHLTWDAPGWTLESASEVDGIWLPFGQQTSPVVTNIDSGTRFFRLRQ